MKNEIPTEAEFLEYAKTLSIYTPSLDYSIKAKYEMWVESGWVDGYGKPIKVWKSKLRIILPFLKPVTQPVNQSQFDRLKNMEA